MLHHHHSATCKHHNKRSAQQLLDASLLRAKEGGLRRTRALENVLEILIAAHQPMNLADISESPDLKSKTRADRATVYRLLVKLEERGIIRRLGLHDRSTYYTMLESGRHDDYLICTSCGRIQRLDISCPVEAL
ncbi:MAG: transcriptional repressor, partial [Verrucomicrobiaceae bacterium]|nr:transcriptional repressor [Verrucomicrobiaceae bacterium]